jgi:integrase
MAFASKVLRFALEEGHIPQKPVMPSQSRRDRPRPSFSRNEYRQLLAFLKNVEGGRPSVKFKGSVVDWELRAIVSFMVNSFSRPGDIFALKHRHVAVIPADAEGPAYLKLVPPPSKGHADAIITMPIAVPIYERARLKGLAAGFGRPDDYVFLPGRANRAYAKEIVRRQFSEVLRLCGLKDDARGEQHTLYSLRHTAIVFRIMNAEDLDLLTLARTCRTSVEMIDRFYAKGLTAEMNRQKLHGFRRPTRYSNVTSSAASQP